MEEIRQEAGAPEDPAAPPVAGTVLDGIRLLRGAIQASGKSRYASLTLTSLEQAELWWLREQSLV